jgi:hypothetical protein
LKSNSITTAQDTIFNVGYWCLLALLASIGSIIWHDSEYVLVDHAQLVYHARELWAGRVPYRDIVTHHFLGYVLPFSTLGLFLPLDGMTLKIAAWLSTVTSAVFVYLAAERIGGLRAARLAGLLAITIGQFYSWQGNLLQVQSNLVPLLALSLYLTATLATENGASKRCMFQLLSLIAGLLFIFDQRSIVFAPIVALVWFWNRQYLGTRGLLGSLFFFSLPLGCALLYLGLHGALKEFYLHAIHFPLYLRNQHGGTSVLTTSLQFVDYAFRSEPIALGLALASCLLLLFQAPRRRIGVLLIFGVVLGFAYAGLGGRIYTNYLLVTSPFLVVALALLPNTSIPNSGAASRILNRALIALALVCLLAPSAYLLNGKRLYFGGDEAQINAVVKYVEETSPAPSSVFVWGVKPQVYLKLHRLSPFRDISLVTVTGANFNSTDSSAQGFDPDMVSELQKLFVNSPPEIVVAFLPIPDECDAVFCFGRGYPHLNLRYQDVSHLQFFKEALEQYYEPALSLPGRFEDVRVFRLRPRHAS